MKVETELAALLQRSDLLGRAFTTDYTAVVERWLCSLYEDLVGLDDGVALVATGGQGRGELSPFSDLDLLLLHDGSLDGSTAQSLWYPLWDAKMKVGHAVRTPAETLQLAATDLATATGLLSARHLAGDASLTAALVEAHLVEWKRRAKRAFGELVDTATRRHADASSVANALEPDLKEGRGGLRDVHLLGWIEAADQGLDIASADDLAEDYDLVLAVRVELHRLSNRPGDVIRLDDQAEVASRLGFADAMELMSELAGSARRIAWAADDACSRLQGWLRPSSRLRPRRSPSLEGPYELDGGFVVVAPDAPSSVDAIEPLLVALAAARHGARIHRGALERISTAAAAEEPWPDELRRRFVELLACGPAAIEAIESLDLVDSWVALIPEWAPLRCRSQRNAYHRFAVDRHSWECVAMAADFFDRVDRGDLLLLAALFHDIGKGYPGDHSVVGVQVARPALRRMGLSEADVRTVEVLIEHHLLLADVATRRDLDDPLTILSVAARVETVQRLGLLEALTTADSLATGSTAWSPWKAGLVAELVRKVGHVLGGNAVEDVTGAATLSADRRRLIEGRDPNAEPVVEADGNRVTIVCIDRPGVFSRITGVLALNGLDVLEATVQSDDGWAVEEFVVESTFASEIPWAKVARDIDRALRSRFALEARLAERRRSYRRAVRTVGTLEPKVRVVRGEASDGATVVEVIGRDRIGLLHQLTRVLSDLDVDIVRAKIATLGGDVVDTFYVRGRDDLPIDDDDLVEIKSALLFELRRPDA